MARSRTGLVAALTCLWGAASPARAAQPSAPAPAEPAAPSPAAAAAPATASAPVSVVAPAPANDPQDVITTYDRALDELLMGDAARAVRDLDEVAARSVEPGRQAAARDLATRVRRVRGLPAPGAATAAGEAAAAVGGDAGPNHEGRAFFLGTESLLGLGYGWAVPTVLDIHNTRGFIGLYMLTAGASFAIPYLVTRHETVTWGMANAAWLGGTRGAVHGLLVAAMIGGSLDSVRGTAGSLMAGSVAELAAATWWASRSQMTPGTAHTLGSGSDFGMLWGAAIAHGLHLNDTPEHSDDFAARSMTSSAFAGSVVGVVGAHFLAEGRRYTWGDAEVMRFAGLMGGYVGGVVADDAGITDSHVIVPALSLGALVGLGAGDVLVRDRDFGVGQGLLVDLGAIAGGLVAAGTTYLIIGAGYSEKPYLTAGLAGGALGFGAIYLTLDAPASRRAAAKLGSLAARGPRAQLLPLLGVHGERGVALGGLF